MGSVELGLRLSHSLVGLLLLSLCLVERLVGSVLLVLSGRELGLSVGQRRERIGMLGLSLIDGGVCRGRSSRGSVQLGLRVSRSLLLDGERLLSSLHLTLGSGHFLRGGCEFALALRLDRLGGLQRGSSGVHLCLGSLVLRACCTLLGTVEVGFGSVIARLSGIHIRVGRVLCLLSCRKLVLGVLLFSRGSASSSLGIRNPSLRVGGLLLCLLQLARGLLSSGLSCGYGLGRGIGCGSLGSLKRSLGIACRLLGGSQSFVLVRQVLLSGTKRSLSVLKRLHIRIGLVLRSAHLLFQLGRSGRSSSIACAASRVIGTLRLLLVGGSGIVGSGGRIQIGLGGSGLSASRIDRSLQVGDLLRRRHRARASTSSGRARQRRHHRSRCTRNANTIRALCHRGQRRQQRPARHGDRRRGNRRHAPGGLRLTRSAAIDVLIHVLAHCRFLPTMS